MEPTRPIPRQRYGTGRPPRALAQEVAIALTYNGSTQAVMMATPADIIDFAYGFSLTEGLASFAEIETIEVVDTDLGVDVQIWVAAAAQARLATRRRNMAGPVGCGLCGIDSLEQAVRTPAQAVGGIGLSPSDITSAMQSLTDHQPLHDSTRAVHAAALWLPDRGIVMVREDVGRHNALDKLGGALVQSPMGQGAIIMTSRVSIDIVQKCAAMGQSMLIAVSAPTQAAVQMADAAGITLIANARPDGFEAFTHLNRITTGARHVA